MIEIKYNVGVFFNLYILWFLFFECLLKIFWNIYIVLIKY